VRVVWALACLSWPSCATCSGKGNLAPRSHADTLTSCLSGNRKGGRNYPWGFDDSMTMSCSGKNEQSDKPNGGHPRGYAGNVCAAATKVTCISMQHICRKCDSPELHICYVSGQKLTQKNPHITSVLNAMLSPAHLRLLQTTTVYMIRCSIQPSRKSASVLR